MEFGYEQRVPLMSSSSSRSPSAVDFCRSISNCNGDVINNNSTSAKAKTPLRKTCSIGVNKKFTVINYGNQNIRSSSTSEMSRTSSNILYEPTLCEDERLETILTDTIFLDERTTKNDLQSSNPHKIGLSQKLSNDVKTIQQYRSTPKLDSIPSVECDKLERNHRPSTDVYNTIGVEKNKRVADIAKRGRLFAGRKTRRLIYQNGECNVSYVNVEKRGARYMMDIFTTLLELRWGYNILVYLVAFVMSWIVFALFWWAIHAAVGVDSDGKPCVEGVTNFQTALLFSIETQHTIGYGSRSITDRCPVAYVCLMVQCVFGAVMQCIVTGIIFAKVARPNRRAETVIFSKKAVICREYGSMCLIFRVADMRNSQLIGVNINAILVRKVRLQNGVDLYQERLKIATESEDDFYFLAWPIKLVHRINETSPFWDLSPNDLVVADFEILVVLEANCEATGATTQVRTSYLPCDILWGHILAPLLTYQKDNGHYKVDYSQFNIVQPVNTPELSPRDIATSQLPPCPSYAKLQITDETSIGNSL